MNQFKKYSAVVIVLLILIGAWLVYFHNELVAGALPRWGWVQGAIGHLGQHKDVAPEEDEDPDNTKNEIPVHVGHVSVATLHQYIDGIGTVAPRPARAGQAAGSADIASPAPGVVSKVVCQLGQVVHAGDALIVLDDRIARSAEDQAAAALEQEKAALALLNAAPKPEQLQIAQLAVDKSQGAMDFAQKNFDRQKLLAADQGTSGKNLEQAALDLASARNDLLTAQKQLSLLNAAPRAEELSAEQAKVRQAEAALSTAKTQRQMTTIAAPIDGTVVELAVNGGESIDSTKTLVRLVAMDRLMVDVDVPAEDLPEKSQGLPARVSVGSPAAGAAGIDAKVTYVSAQVEAKNGSVMLGIDLPADANLRPGLTVRVRIIAQEHKDVLAVPRVSVFPNENGDTTLAVIEGEQANHRAVKTGLEQDGMIEISGSDIKEGMTVVTAGAFGLQATQATHVKVVE